MNDYEMFSKSGNNACQSLVNRITKKINGTKRVTADEIKTLVKEGMEKIAIKHPEVGDSEPGYHIRGRVDKAMREAGYQEIWH